MKIQLDTENKTVKIEQDVNLNEFITKVKLLLGKDFKDYILDTGGITYWFSPLEAYPLTVYQPFNKPFYYNTPQLKGTNCKTTASNYSEESSTNTYNINDLVNFEM
jgi:hypothetical protein